MVWRWVRSTGRDGNGPARMEALRHSAEGEGVVLDIDGAAFSGSGMIVRQAVAYAALTGTAIRIRAVRAQRPRPGLRHQHLCAVDAVREMVGGQTEGAHVGSREFTFSPGSDVPRGSYRFDVGSAGSATALSLALLPVLASAPGPVQVELVGGLFQHGAPSAFHLQHVLAPLLDRMGLHTAVTMARPGYVPAGGGLLRLECPGRCSLLPLDARTHGKVRDVWGIALSSHLRVRNVSHRMATAAAVVLTAAGYEAAIEERGDSTASQPGAGVGLFADLDGGNRLGADGAGAPGRSAERIGTNTARRLLEDVRTGATLDRYASDQVIVFAAMAAGRTRVQLASVSDHVRTGLWLADLFGVATARLDGRHLRIDGGGLDVARSAVAAHLPSAEPA
jgi:RNA 3'-terminal phosphate cyclase (ATP)